MGAERFPLDANPAALGASVRRVLELAPGLPYPPRGPDDFDSEMAALFGLRSARGLYTRMRCVGLTFDGILLTCAPLRHGRGYYWEGFPDHWRGKEDVVVSSSASDAEWGAAALEALARSV